MKNLKTLGDWCKFYEKEFSPEQMIPELPVICRIDGVSFSQWTKGLEKPFDMGLNQLMVETTKFLVKETNAIVGFTQSDEITIILYSGDRNTEIYHNGRKQKILSKLTGKLVTFFNDNRPKYLPNHNKTANFDCRIYQVPTLAWATNQLLWRENDATKNSIQMLAQSLFSHKSLQGLNGDQLQEKMWAEKGVNWNNLPPNLKRGTYVKRIKSAIKFSTEEIEKLPKNHQARINPDLEIIRNKIEIIEYPIFNTIENKVGVIFNNEQPKLRT